MKDEYPMSNYFSNNDSLHKSYWLNIQSEYKSARATLVSICNEFDSMAAQTQPLIDELDNYFSHLCTIMENAVPLSRVPTAPLPPCLNRKNIKGLIAYRAWNSQVKGSLHPCVVSTDSWNREVAFADEIPSERNAHGLHATKIEVFRQNGYGDYISGLVDLYGRVIEHSDGVLRAECARILCIFIEVDSESNYIALLTGVYEAFKNKYPNTPIHMLTPQQKELFIFREILISQGAV